MPTPGHLIGFTISPVQAFIREARKAQDIWSGSLLLSHMAQTALTLLDQAPGRERVSPARVPFPPERPSVTNEGVVFVPLDEAAALALARQAADSAARWWADVAAQTRGRLEGENLLFRSGDLLLWDEQIQAQFTVAWAVEPVADRDSPQAADALLRLRRLLASAKRARRITPYTGDSRPKCTLSGDWEQMGPVRASVREDNEFWGRELPRRLRRIPRGNDVRWVVTARLEGGGRERLCAVSLTKRLAPALVLAGPLGFRPHGRPDSQVRFPSTTAIAWVEAKANLLQVARARPDTFAAALRRFNDAVEAYCEAADLPRGWHVLPCHDALVHGLTGDLLTQGRRFLQLDGSWLGPTERESEEPAGFAEEGAQLGQAREELRQARDELDRLTRDARPRVGLGRTPPVALLRADADRMGQLSAEVVRRDGLRGATRLSEALGSAALPQAVEAIEISCRGKVVFAGGDELIALVPAAWALKAASLVSQAYEQAGQGAGFPELTCSVAVVLVHPRSPLRLAVQALTDLLDQAKEHARDAPGPEGVAKRSRRALGLAVIPGSGNLKQGVVGLHVPRAGAPANALRPVVAEVLTPLAEALAWEVEEGVAVSPRLYREWVETFEGVGAAQFDELLPDGRGEGIALAEFRRLARRHIALTVQQGQVSLSPAMQQALQDRLGASFSRDPDELRQALADDLTDRFRSLLLSGSYDGAQPRTAPAWRDLRGLLLAITTLGTREVG